MPLQIFAFNPIAAMVVCGIFAIGVFNGSYTNKSRFVLGICSAVWLLYTSWELYMLNWRSPTGDMAIRVDLVVFGPLVLLVALIGFFALVWGRRRNND